MNIESKRIELAKWILETNEDDLIKIEAIKSGSEEIVCKTVNGISLNKEQYKQRLIEAEARIEAGEFTNHEDLLEEMQTW